MMRSVVLLSCFFLAVSSRRRVIDLAVVDLGPFTWPELYDDAARRDSAAALLDALSGIGMASLVNHGVDAARSLAASRALFNLPDAIKADHLADSPPSLQRGFLPEGAESGGMNHEHKEGFAFGYEFQEGNRSNNALEGPNVWPVLSNTLKQSYTAFCAASRAVLQALTLHFADALDGCCSADADRISLSRLNHYFAREEGLGSSAHSDWGLLTLIAADDLDDPDDPALQVWHEGAWWSVRSTRPGALVVNAGDYLALVSNLISPRHRVVSPPKKDRYSYVFFFYPDYNSTIDLSQNYGGENRLSLLECQQQGAESCGGPADSNAALPFGDYIAAKWAQVARW